MLVVPMFFFGDKFLGHSFDPNKMWQNFENFGLDSSVNFFYLCWFLGKKKLTNFSISQNWVRNFLEKKTHQFFNITKLGENFFFLNHNYLCSFFIFLFFFGWDYYFSLIERRVIPILYSRIFAFSFSNFWYPKNFVNSSKILPKLIQFLHF